MYIWQLLYKLMFRTNFFLAFLALFCFQFGYAQEQVSKKEIKKMLSQAAEALYALECQKSLNLAKNALNLAHDAKDENLMAKAYNIIGLNFEEFSSPISAISFFEKALDHATISKNDSIKLWANNNLGTVYSYKNSDFKRGIKYYLNALEFARKIKDSTEIVYTQLNICSAYFAENDFKNGIKYLEDSNIYVKKHGELEAKIHVFSMYGSYFSYLKQNKKAEFFFEQAIAIAKTSKQELISSNLSDVYFDYSEYFKKNNNPIKQLEYLKLHEDLDHQIYNEEKKNDVKDIASEIELEEYKREVNKIEGENKEQTQWLNASKLAVLFFLIMLGTLLLLIRSMRRNDKLREKSNQELQVANLALQKAKEEADNSNMLKTQFVSTITHELRTPLYGVVGITNIIIEEHKELADSPHLNSLKFSAGYLLSLVNDLLQINKIEENRITLESMIFNLPDEIKTIVDSLQFIARKNNNKLVIEIDTDIPESLIGDKLRLSQVFMNLISNALKFTKDGEVKIIADLVKTEGTKRHIKFQVVDTGVGIAKDDQVKVFEKFVQIERKEGDYQGTGLGLSIVKKLVEIFGGQIELESEEGFGTNFFFTIAFEADEKQKIEIINNIVVDLSTSYNYRVLVVEDNKINQIVTKKILETNHFKCAVVDDGYAALELLADNIYDVILMDINMPIINGFETSKLIRKKGITTPIIALTAFDKQEVVEQVLASGMNDIIIKPFEKSKLFQVIAGLVDTSETV
jgi:signal transduction histidine kinase/ActR/RegA family two-component response regulator